MPTFLDTLTRAMQDALTGYQQYQTHIRPAMEDRALALEDRRRRLAHTNYEMARAIYGSDEAIAEALGEQAYTDLVRTATGGGITPTFRDVPITERIRSQRQVGTRTRRLEGPFEDVERPRAPVVFDTPRVTGTGPGLVRAGLPQPTVIGPAPVAVPQEIEEPVFEDAEEERPTGRTRRELVLPGRIQEERVQIPGTNIRLTLRQIRELGEPEMVRSVLGVRNPDAIARLQLDIQKAEFDQTFRLAQQAWEQFRHSNPPAYQQADLRLRQLAQESLDAHRAALEAIQRGNLQEAKRWHDIQGRNQAEANAIRRESVGVQREAVRARASGANLRQASESTLRRDLVAISNAITNARKDITWTLDEEEKRLINARVAGLLEEAAAIQEELARRRSGGRTMTMTRADLLAVVRRHNAENPQNPMTLEQAEQEARRRGYTITP